MVVIRSFWSFIDPPSEHVDYLITFRKHLYREDVTTTYIKMQSGGSCAKAPAPEMDHD